MDGEERFVRFKVEISILREHRDWSYHLRPDFCFFEGGAFFWNLTTCLVAFIMRSMKEETMLSTSGVGRCKQRSRSSI